jgi:PadR family transcriptional regulator, regulatory protein PadR
MPRKKDDADSVRLSAIDEDILTGLLNRELYGLEILDQLNLGRPFQLSFGSLYPALNRLEKKGFIEWRWGDIQDGSGGARRKYYKVTGLGGEVLDAVQRYRYSLTLRPSAQSLPQQLLHVLTKIFSMEKPRNI